LLAITLVVAFRLQEQSDRNRRLLYVTRTNLAFQAYARGSVAGALQLLEDQPTTSSVSRLMNWLGMNDDLRGFEWYYLWRVCHNKTVIDLPSKTSLLSVAVSPDSKIIAASDEKNNLLVWNKQDQSELAQR